MVLLAAGIATYGQINTGRNQAIAQALFTDTVDKLTASRHLTEVVGDLRLDVVQVQQWLTDISATRGLDGLNDGYDEAEAYASRFAEDLAKARSIALEIGETALAEALDHSAADFPAYYDVGKAMAARYIAEGPAGGNAMMAAFDAAAATLASDIDALIASAQSYSAKVAEVVEAERQQLQAAQDNTLFAQLAGYCFLIVAIAGMTVFFAGYVLRRLRSMSMRMTAIAASDHSTGVYGSSFWDELREIASAADIFRSNGIRLEALAASEAEQTAARRAERRAMMVELQSAFGRVVDAAISGDFSQRVPTSFPDPELNALAVSFNGLVEALGQGLGETADVLAAFAACDFSVHMATEQIGAFARLRDDTNAVARNLSDVISRLRHTSGSLRTATSEILAGANDLADRTTRQAATIEQTSAAMEDLSNMISQNARGAAAAGAQSQSVSQKALASEQAMSRATEAMSHISESSSRLQSFIGVIDDIAFQTNLLALNASVEAARAGEAGKGFAVVAIEVRRLAQSAAEASREAQQLVDRSVLGVQDGSAILGEVASRLSEVTRSIAETATKMDEIARVSDEQSKAVSEVSASVRQMDEMTQHNAALVEETNAAIEQTEAQAQNLDTMVRTFTIDETGESRSRGGMRRAA
ncbi:methyl-accepting chemotaxis protein [Devosia sp. FKR38]|uniref:methyl-accepting chemotaxis protein n=1 Tax=Devosia sp. FKR38 TaxID=2562312 RepID=UPI001484F411|nr:methyl-accepting chemotaxis protein [Devosia sp. FKR38]